MNILLVGSGAREHALAKVLHASSKTSALYCCAASLNSGIKKLTKEYWLGNICNAEEITKQAIDWKIDLAIIGPEAPLEKAIVDALLRKGIPTVGPKQSLAKLETSKIFTRELMQKYKIPGTAYFRAFRNLDGVNDFLHTLGQGNYVIKANGLMGGKGVKVAREHLHSFQDAYLYCQELIRLNQSFIIEEKFLGQEFSFHCFSDGNNLVPMPLIQDHKRAFEFDTGPNTGGMGSYTDVDHRLPFITNEDYQAALQINKAIITALRKEWDEKYIGILYGSFIATKDGIKLIEYNVRFGDPEAINVLALLESDFVAICEAMVSGTLTNEMVRFAHKATVCKYAVPYGYPFNPQKNSAIDLSQLKNPDNIYLGSVGEVDGKLMTTNSRAVAVLGVSDSIYNAEKLVEEEICRIQGSLFHRRDIGTWELIDKKIRQMQNLRKKEYV